MEEVVERMDCFGVVAGEEVGSRSMKSGTGIDHREKDYKDWSSFEWSHIDWMKSNYYKSRRRGMYLKMLAGKFDSDTGFGIDFEAVLDSIVLQGRQPGWGKQYHRNGMGI